MKNQYTGDIGDYTKLALIRVIENSNLLVGVNWYFTPDDEGSKDGRRIEYLDAPCDTPDKELFDSLYHIVKIKQVRTVKALMDGGLLKKAVFYSEPLVLAQVDNPRAKRGDWHKKSLDCLNSVDVVFLDPDNGFIPDSVSPYSSTTLDPQSKRSAHLCAPARYARARATRPERDLRSLVLPAHH